MKLGWFSVLTALSVMAAGSLTGFAGTGTASAASYTHLCTDDHPGDGSGTYPTYLDLCADSKLGLGEYVAMLVPPVSSLTNWTYPNTAGARGAIRQADNVNYCIQVDASASDGSGGYLVRGASCVGDSAEQWVNVYNSYYHRTVFESLYDSHLCLTEISTGPAAQPQVLSADPCGDDNSTMSWEELWGTS